MTELIRQNAINVLMNVTFLGMFLSYTYNFVQSIARYRVSFMVAQKYPNILHDFYEEINLFE